MLLLTFYFIRNLKVYIFQLFLKLSKQYNIINILLVYILL